jgi:hypothetical protein
MKSAIVAISLLLLFHCEAQSRPIDSLKPVVSQANVKIQIDISIRSLRQRPEYSAEILVRMPFYADFFGKRLFLGIERLHF